jgi:hypothetical protein
MIRKDLENGYELIADEGKELIVLVEDIETARAKQVFIPSEGTLNEWIEVPEKIVEVQLPQEPTKEDKIAELERQLAELKAQTL